MNLSLMSCHMMRVISSPSSSTTGFLTLILVCPELVEAFRVWEGGLEVALTRAVSAARRVEGGEAIVRERVVRGLVAKARGRRERAARGSNMREGFMVVCG
jgi:hypothetical protein